MTRTEFAIHTVRGRCTTLPGGSFGFDRAWAPQGQGSVTIPLSEWEAMHANRAPNPSFDTDASGWFGLRTVTRITGDAIAGSFGRLIAQAGDASLLVYADVSIEVGRSYDVLLERVRTNVASKWAEITVEWRSSAWAVLGTITAPRVPLYSYWEEQLELRDLVPPAGAVGMRVLIRVHNTQAGGGYLPATGNRIDVDGLAIVEQVLKPKQRQPVLLVAETWNGYSDGLGSLELDGAGTTLGTGTWPLPTIGEHYIPEGAGGVGVDVQREAWHVWPQEARIDRAAGTVEITISTIEALLQQAVNLSGSDIAPPRSTTGLHYLGRMLMVLASMVGVRVFVPAITDATITFTPDPWRAGQSLWEWFNRVRSQAAVSYELDPASNAMEFYGSTRWAFSVPSGPLLEHATVVGTSARSDGVEYADALTVEWKWVDAAGSDQTQSETVLAASVRSWSQVTRHVVVERPGPPVAGVAQRMVNNMSAYRFVTTYRTPTTHYQVLYPLGQGADPWQRIQFDFDAGTCRVMILERDRA